MLSRRRFMQLGVGAAMLPLLMEGTAGAAGATEHTLGKVKANPTAILQFGQMQGESYDPIRQVGVEYIQLYALFDMLLSYSASGAIVPRLATYQATADTIRLTLRKGVKFQDGTPFNAQAVQYSLNRVQHDPSSTIAANVSMLQSVKVVDAYTVDLALTEPSVQAMLFQLADRPGMIVSPTAVEKAGSSANFSLKPVGAGAYAVKGQWFPRESMSVRAWSGYWDKSAQMLGGVDFTNVLQGATVNAMRANSVDVNVLAPADAAALKGDSSIKIASGPGDFTMGLNINLTKAPFNNLKVRQAVSLAIDRVAVNKAMTNGLGSPAFQFATSNSPAYDPSLNQLNAFNPKKAKQLLKAAGFSGGLSFPSIIGATAAVYVQFGELIQSQLAEVGIKMDLQQINQADVIPMLWGSEHRELRGSGYGADPDRGGRGDHLRRERRALPKGQWDRDPRRVRHDPGVHAAVHCGVPGLCGRKPGPDHGRRPARLPASAVRLGREEAGLRLSRRLRSAGPGPIGAGAPSAPRQT
jgi:peptide/nickel transport system substrate-binding protein